jgi:hypothetical protein
MDKEQNHAALTAKKVKESRPKRGERAQGAVRQKKRATPSKIVGTNPKTAKPVPQAPGVEELIENWRPYLRSDRLNWPEIAQAVRAHVLAAKPRDLVVAEKYLRTLAKHVMLQNKAGHLITDAGELFSDRALIATFGKSNPFGLSVSSLATELSYMRRMREEILPDLFAIPTPFVKGTSRIALPYMDDELKILLT